MADAPLVFLDTETTGLSLEDDIWEFAAIRREPDGTETSVHLFIDHNPEKCARLPESFRADHVARFPACGSSNVTSRYRAAVAIYNITEGAHVVGAVPNFDTERIARLFAAEGLGSPRWHYHLIDVENLAVGYLYGRYGQAGGPPLEAEGEAVRLPWNSDYLSLACGVEPPTTERHTAMGDARWARELYDAITGGSVGEQLTLDAVTEEAIDRVERNADRDWKTDAYNAVVWLARRQERFTSNDVLRVLENTSEASTHELRAMGAVMRLAQRHGLIEATGEYVSSDRCHRYPKRVWRSRIVQGRVA